MTKPRPGGILALDFPAADAAGVDELNAKANEGFLTEAELEAEHRGLACILAAQSSPGAAAALTEDLTAAVGSCAGNRLIVLSAPAGCVRRPFHFGHIIAKQYAGQDRSRKSVRLLAGTAINKSPELNPNPEIPPPHSLLKG